MTLTRLLTTTTTTPITTSLDLGSVTNLTIAITAALQAHVAGFQAGLTKEQVVNVDGSDNVADYIAISGTSFNANQLTGSRQPLYFASGINGHPSVKWNGGTDLLNFGSIFNPSTTSFTISVVLQAETNSATKTILSQVAVSESFLNTNSDTSWRSTIGAGSFTTPFSTNPTILTLRWNSGTTLLSLYVNGILKASGNKTPNSLTVAWIIGSRNTGAANPYKGHIGEVAIYNAALSDDDLALNHTYFSNKWDIALV